ncbi:MAG: 23S rRNA (adenine(2503)-C(2))-methyltransferase RlmN [Nitrosarchaeum sp.]|jgi:23S rRNA (adenine2503-C2)-methyltransferase|nr:23S rRNA (adenine(2503)-C(2))-methyltransferase RlmN [Nitrosarchaeum sp.]MBP0119790.1 23S rRNA (adenine(2503)-C(2))-methyltransferase RlmN [Nitrosarchaeum sp.]MBP0134213.1 23S rRNA (adenine(2503)-C(2))-methyltransferase RlmN [Nitrosarchaeum sp.]MSV26517.1 23S rRNA (adenine(2503)-C(2))-methyltransferase RlmN [Nitrosarchaeum sp.]PHY08653.1 MAG: 23S rRNA (adenine(2503)-C(2))-methyltransferase RlmN [Nitrosarchaeum sp.]
MKDLYRLMPEEMEKMVVDIGQQRYRADQILYPLYYKFPKDISELRQLPSAIRDKLVLEGFMIGSATEIHRVVSDDGDTTKLLLNLVDGTPVETVLIQYPSTKINGHPRSTICVSTQVGCAMGCVFCATGQMGFMRNLKAEEIIAQVIHFADLLAKRNQHITNLVFMGMGEPLANYDETIRAVRLLTHQRGFGIGQRNITISTIGIISGIDRLADEDLQIGLAISLHAPNDKLRQKLVPTAKPNSVNDLIAAGKRYFMKTGRRVTFEYALIEGVNDSLEIARELALLLKGNGSHVNLIPINPTAGNFQRPNRKNVIEFEKILYNAGVNCTVRVEKGSEISAACGQLRTDIIG